MREIVENPGNQVMYYLRMGPQDPGPLLDPMDLKELLYLKS